jgi:acetyl esterase/lipase
MSLHYEPEFARVFEALLPNLPKREKLNLGTITVTREQREAGIKAAYGRLPDCPDVTEKWHHAKSTDGFSVPIQAFVEKDASPEATSAIIHFHGGGLVLGSSQLFSKYLAGMVSKTSVPIFSVNYRLAPEHNGATLVEDCYAAVAWVHENAEALGIDASRIGLFGESAGGGLAAGVALLARDRNLDPPLAKQILVYPMLDDRTTISNPAIEPFAFWKTEDNATAWKAVLGVDAGDAAVDHSPYVVPARAREVAGLPPTYIDVGTLDIFRDECIAYANLLLASNIEVELHVYPGLPHAFEMLAPAITATKKASDNRLSAILSI